MEVCLRPITIENWRQCIKLTLKEEQRDFVASNVYSLAEAAYETCCVPLAIYDGDMMVGFIMYALDPDDEAYWIYRFMVDRDHQGQGYGRKGLRQVIERLKVLPGCDKIFLSYEPENLVAEKLYESMGFAKTGQIEHGEIVSCLNLG